MAAETKSIKLSYFSLPGRAEAARMALRVGGIEFEDHTVAFGEEWKDLKPKTPWGSMPLLEVDGVAFAQCRGVTRYCCKIAGLYPEDPLQAALADSLHCVCEDVGPAIMASSRGLEGEEKNAARVKACSEGGKPHEIANKIDAFIAKHGQDGHSVGNTLTLADLVVCVYFSNFTSGFYDGVPSDWVKNFPNIDEVRKNVFMQPALREYYDANKAKYKNFAYYPQPDLKFTYFNLPGRGESIRMALRLGGLDFEDNRVNLGEEWTNLKPSTPWGSMPILEVNGVEVAQTRAVLRYACKLAGLYPEDPVQAGLTDSIHCVLEDIVTAIEKSKGGLEGDEAIKAVATSCLEGKVRALADKLEAFVAANGKDGHSIGDTLLLGDLAIACYFSNYSCGLFPGVPADWTNNFPKLAEVRKMVFNLPLNRMLYDETKEQHKAWAYYDETEEATAEKQPAEEVDLDDGKRTPEIGGTNVEEALAETEEAKEEN